MRRALILVLLLLGVQMIMPLGRFTPSSAGLLTFGFLILAAYTVGEIGESVGIPKLVGYLVAGMVFGPAALGVVSHDSVLRLASVSDLAVALIAFTAGAELKWQELRDDGVKYIKVLTAEMSLTFVAMLLLVLALHRSIPVLATATEAQITVFALLFATVAIAHSPAATLGLLSETHARGPVAKTTLGVVLTSDVVLILLFTLMATLSRIILPPSGSVALPSLGSVMWEIGGAVVVVVVGGAIGGVVTLYLRFVSRDLLLFGIIVALFGSEIARLANVELLLTLLTAGFVTQNTLGAETADQLRDAVERASAPLFVMFFALADAAIMLRDLASFAFLLVPLVLVRIASIMAGTWAGARWAGMLPLQRRYLSAGLIAQAGVAIGLAGAVQDVYPTIGGGIRTLALALIAINQLIGPIIFRRALAAADEIPA